jgi:hypothetical protein
MARLTQPVTYEDIRALSPQDYARFQEAAKARALALRREAVSGGLDLVAEAVVQGARAVGRLFAHAPRSGRRAGAGLA